MQHVLDAVFRPKSVAVIGAKDTPGSVGRTILLNLTSGGGAFSIIPVNPKRTEVCGLPCIPSVEQAKEPIDLAVIVVPAANVLDVMNSCARAKVKAAIVIAAGFKESGPEGLRLETAVADAAREGGIRMIGPNCLGVMNPHCGLNASFGSGMPRKGPLAFISQSGAMCAAVLDWSLSDGIGFSSFVSIGSMADVGWADLIDYFGDDPATTGILMYMETVGDPRSFLSAASRVAHDKPIIVIKPGRTREAASAAASHTGALVGSDAVFDAACERSGVVRVNTVSELFDLAEVLSSHRRHLSGPRLAIVTNAGGPAVLATDAVVENGAQMAKLAGKTIESLSSFLPAAWSHSNPVDILGDADPDRYAKAVEIAMKDTQVDGVLAVLTPQAMTDPAKTAERLRDAAFAAAKPLLASWMGGGAVKEGRHILSSSGIPCFEYPDDAAWSFAAMWRRSFTLNVFRTPPRWRPCPSRAEMETRIAKAREILYKAVAEKCSFLSERESKQLLKLYGIPVVEALLATTNDEAAALADRIGYPVVLKIESSKITHKSDIGGVALGLVDKASVRKAFTAIRQRVVDQYGLEGFSGITVQKMVSAKGIELIIGSSIDPQFGPVVLFGSGGIYVEAFKDNALGLPPLNSTLARRMIERTKTFNVLASPRGGSPVPLEPIEDLLIALSDLVLELPEVAECDMNPVLASSSGVFCLDARIVVSLPTFRVTPACAPYRIEYMRDIQLGDGRKITVRPARTEDCSLMAEFHDQLSTQAEYKVLFASELFSKKMPLEELMFLCGSSCGRTVVLVAECEERQRSFAGVCVLFRRPSREAARWVAVDQRYPREEIEKVLISQSEVVAEREGL